ncbi:uncharacterized protein IUM83_03056 [Phytophthora cinnamomi]|uniref:uncharacterized protein n=1 Tax=Phytophthora cinnamomi TaxID=4785 RepID=UPI00355971F8|nr:hypothetical protein IUM83_03056 [Phytophthora cinnamomi]
MTTSDAAFLAEVEHFLTSSDLLTIPTLPDIDNDRNEASTPQTEPASKRVVNIAPQLGTAHRKLIGLKPKDTKKDGAKRELERAKDRKRRQAYRERRRQERESLKQEIQKLTEELQKTQGGDNAYTSAWKMVAERQLAARRNAEAEQQRLWTSIDARASLIQEFGAVVNERVNGLEDFLATDDQVIEDTADTAFYQHKRVRQELSDEAIFAAYIEELDAVYAQTDEILQAGKLDPTEANWDEPSETWTKDLDTGYFEYRGKVTLPFDYRDSCRSRWYTAPLHHRQENRQLYTNVNDPENTIALKFRITTRLTSGKSASVVQRLVLQRHEEEERMVIVWRLFTEGEGPFIGMHADETGWEIASPALNSSKRATVMTTCVNNVPMHLDGVANRDPNLKQFARKLFDWGSENNVEVTNELKNMLLMEK